MRLRGSGAKMIKESEIQKMIFQWAELQQGKYPFLELMYHVPNGGSRHILEAVNLKKQGVKAGVPDIGLPVPKGGYHGLYLELKALKGKLSESQKNWLMKIDKQGYKTEIAYSFDEATDKIKKYIESEVEISG